MTPPTPTTTEQAAASGLTAAYRAKIRSAATILDRIPGDVSTRRAAAARWLLEATADDETRRQAVAATDHTEVVEAWLAQLRETAERATISTVESRKAMISFRVQALRWALEEARS